MSYLIVGASNYSAIYMIKNLLENTDKDIIAVDTKDINLPASNKLIIKKIDFNNRLFVEEILNEYKPNRILLYTGSSTLNNSFDDPVGTIMSTTRITLNVLESVRSIIPHSKIIIVSSGDVYGIPKKEDARKDETAFLRPQSPFGSAKACSEKIASQYNRSYNIKTIIARPFGIIGPDLDDSSILGDLAKQLAIINVNKSEAILYTENIEIERDFLCVKDVCNAYSMLFEKGISGNIYNICESKIQPIRWLLDEMIRYSKADIEIRSTPASDHIKEIPILGGDNAKMKNEIGWYPQQNIIDIIHKLYDYWEYKIKNQQIKK